MLDGKIDYQQLKLICVSGLSGRVSEIRIPMISYVQNETSQWFHMVPVPLHRVFAPRNFRASELRFDAARWASLRMRAATTWKPWP